MAEEPDENEGDEGILTPDELGVEDEEEVETLDENRFLVSTGPADDGPGIDDPADFDVSDDDRRASSSPPRPPLTALEEQYAVDLAVKADDSVDSARIASNNVVETFEELLLWYATQVDDSTPPEDVIEILLAESAFDR
jgi:hypothetical protein